MKLIICRGLPASGKTTVAKKWVAEDPSRRARVNRDDFRTMFHDSRWTGIHDCEAQVTAAQHAAMTALLKRGVDVICDDTNLPQRTARDIARLGRLAGAEIEVWDLTNVDLETCLMRDKLRENFVGGTVILDKYERYVKGRSYPLPWPEDVDHEHMLDFNPYVTDPSLPPAIIVDIDGTVALKGTRSAFDESRVHEDEANWPVVKTVLAMYSAGYKVVFLSGRTDACKDATAKWLFDKELGIWEDLFMRKSGDFRNDAVVKRELFDEHVRGKYNVIAVFDDRQRVVDMWRKLGLTVFQVAEGNF